MDTHQEITACAFLHDGMGKLFVARRAAAKPFLPGKFELVGGHAEFGESLEACIRREVKEELGVDVTVGYPFYAFTYVNGSVHTVEVVCYARLSDDSQRIVLNPTDHSESAWITADEVNSYFADGDDEKRAVIEGFRNLDI